MTSYTQLTQLERYQVHALKRADCTMASIARELNRHISTISRELKRNTVAEGYQPDKAHELALERQRDKPRQRIAPLARALVRHKLMQDWSPEQVSLWLKKNKTIRASHTWIYQYVDVNKQSGGKLYTHLRCQKKRRKRYGSNDRRGQIKNRISIDERPLLVDRRNRIGDWEIDTIVGAKHSGALLSLTERKARHILLAKLPDSSADETVYATLGLLSELKEQVHTITSDNGKEFSAHEDIARVLEAKFYFAHPYSPWERGTNENANGLVRQYFPKDRDFRAITQAELDHAMERLNNRPRKCLGMKTPHEVLCGIKHSVALAS